MKKDLETYIKENQVWLAYEAWTDYLENKHYNAFGYALVGFFFSEEEALEWVKEGLDLTRKNCWAIPEEGAPSRRTELCSRITK